MSENSGSSEKILSVERVNSFYGESHVLHDLSLDVESGEIVSLVGRNGAGKTTTLKTIMGLVSPRSGTIRLGGEEIQDLDAHEVRRQGISWVPEERRVFPSLTVQQNLALAAEGEQLDDVYDQFPKLAERKEQTAGSMSGGEQQMLAIARALLGADIEILLLDEPSEGLAPYIVDDVVDIIEELNDQGTTILLVEQNAELALDLADRAYIIEKGTIQYEGDAAALLDDREILETYLGVT